MSRKDALNRLPLVKSLELTIKDAHGILGNDEQQKSDDIARRMDAEDVIEKAHQDANFKDLDGNPV